MAEPDATELISAYPRAQALADGTLVAVAPGIAREAGFGVPVALTRAVFEDCVGWTDADTARTGAPQDETGRLWDVLRMAGLAAVGDRDADRLTFQLYRVPREGHQPAPELVTLVLVCGPGDQAEPVLTIMESDED
jgi:hypothetical protein